MPADLVIAVIEIRLNYEEQVAAAKTGFLRETYYETNPNFHDQSMRGNLHEAVYRHAEAAGSELAAAKYFDIPNFKLTINTFKKMFINYFNLRWNIGYHFILNIFWNITTSICILLYNNC
jgi:hypothetical protein